MKNRGENVGRIPEGDPKSFRLQAMKKIFEGQKTGQEGKTELTTNMLAEKVPFSLEIYEKELAIKCARKKSELEKLGFNFGDIEEPLPKVEGDQQVSTLVPQESAATASTSQDTREQKLAKSDEEMEGEKPLSEEEK